MMLFFINSTNAIDSLETCNADRITLQSKYMDLTAENKFCQLSDEHYKKLYETEQMWGNLKTIAFMVALGLVAVNK